jgi:hypothetical protein
MNLRESAMNFRKIISLTALLSFVFLMVTSIVLFVLPQGRVAYWSGWTLLGLSKPQWSHLHVNIGLMFWVTMFLHTYLNFKSIMNYLKNKAKNLVVFTSEFNISLAILLVFGVGTYFQVPPFSLVQGLGESFKESASEEYGEPPYGHAELSSVKVFTQKTGMDLNTGMENLKAANIEFDSPKDTMMSIAVRNNMTPKDVYNAMKPKAVEDAPKTLPPHPKPGFGKRTLSDVCVEYDLNGAQVLEILKAEQIDATIDMGIKTVAEKNQVSPIDIYTIIKNGVTAK